MINTKLIYMNDGSLAQVCAKVIDIVQWDEIRCAVVTDKTIFYPQGGGQPYDQGIITFEDGIEFVVQEVRFKDGVVYHISEGNLGMYRGSTVTLTIDKALRELHSKLHTAGHLIDCAFVKMGYALTAGKGYHFPKGAYVEYLEPFDDAQEREALKERLQEAMQDLIDQNLSVDVRFVSYDELKKMCRFVPDYLPQDKPLRISIIDGFEPIACGGTHVSSLQDLKGLEITKVRNKKGCLRVSYDFKQ